MTYKTPRLDRVANFRDLGGAPSADGRSVRGRMLYRSGSLHEMTDRDRATLEGVGISTVIDLRCEWERRRHPGVWPAVETVAAPLADDGNVIEVTRRFEAGSLTSSELEDWWQLVRVFQAPEEHAASMRVVCDTLLKSAGGVVFHCHGGKDRTGLVAAFILDALGVSREAVVADFLRSNDVRPDDRTQQQIAAILARTGAERITERAMWSLTGVRSAWLESLLGQIETRYGSVARYLAGRVGIGEEGLSALRARYLEPR